MEGFKKLTEKQKQEIKGGFAWLALFQSVMTGISIVRSLFSLKGEINSKSFGKVSWDNKNSQQNLKTSQYTQTIVYDY